jgi:tetratricopeptide (TPR) repeat protein
MDYGERAKLRLLYAYFFLFFVFSIGRWERLLVWQTLFSQIAATYLLNPTINKFHRRDYEGASEDFYRALWLDPNDPEAYSYASIARSYLENKPGEIKKYDDELQNNPNDSNAYNNRGNARYEVGDKAGAIADYNRAIEINPNNADAYYNRGYVYYELEDNQKGSQDFQKAAQLFLEQEDMDLYQAVLEDSRQFNP